MPVILVSPSTNNAVVPTPICTVPTPVLAPRVVIPNVLVFPSTCKSDLAVIIPRDSNSITSLLKIDPATEICPSKYATVSVVVPLPTYKLYADLAVVAIPTFLVVWTPIALDAHVPPTPVPPPLFATHAWFFRTYSLSSEGASSIPPPPIADSCCWTLLTNTL